MEPLAPRKGSSLDSHHHHHLQLQFHMASLLPDEILQIIFSLCIPLSAQEILAVNVPRLISKARRRGSLAEAPATNTNIPLVCKRWLRISTSLLYRCVKITSFQTAKALLDVLTEKPYLGAHVKNMHISSICRFSSNIVRLCGNIETLCLNLHADSPSIHLLLALAKINPRVVKFYLGPECGRGAYRPWIYARLKAGTSLTYLKPRSIGVTC